MSVAPRSAAATPPRKVHIPAGAQPVGNKVKGVCACGWTTRPQPDEERALANLESQHGYRAETCEVCGRDRHDFDLPHRDRYAHPRVVTDPDTGDQLLVCADDLQACQDAAARRQRELDTADALDIDSPRPTLRLVRHQPQGGSRSRPDTP